MPRAPGQIDETKRAAVLEAAAAVFAERGFAAPMEAIAARANVSKQTLYNQFGNRNELLRHLVEQRRSLVTAVFDAPNANAKPEDTLSLFAAALLRRYAAPGAADLLRVAIAAAKDQPDIGQTIYETGPKASRERLTEFLKQDDTRARLSVSNPEEAAEMFIGMVAGQLVLGLLMGALLPPDEEAIVARARACAAHFCRAFAPQANQTA
jgi:AcrR family transcriptional regulator